MTEPNYHILEQIVKKLNRLQSPEPNQDPPEFTPEEVAELTRAFMIKEGSLDFDGIVKEFVATTEFLKRAKKEYDDARLFEVTFLKHNRADISTMTKLLKQELAQEVVNRDRVDLLKEQILDILFKMTKEKKIAVVNIYVV